MDRTHDLKTWPEFFHAVKSGAKTFECRKNDRRFAVGDILNLREFEPNGLGHYSGDRIMVEVTFLMDGPSWGIKPGYVVMAIKKL